MISRQNNLELFYIGMPVVWTDDLSVYGHVITKFSRMCRLQRSSATN